MRIDESVLSWIATGRDRSKVRLPGTDRTRPPAETLATARVAAAAVGVTRLADVTRLDVIGIPTFQAVRPTARTLTVSQGKGITSDLAKVSALMEAIELWHAEQPGAPVVTAPPREVAEQLCYPVDTLPLAEPSLLHAGLPLPWVEARSLRDGSRTLVPADVVRLGIGPWVDWNPPVFFDSTNGLASGNTVAEATLHALYEIVERDAVVAMAEAGGRGVAVVPRSLGSPIVDDLCARIEAAGVDLHVAYVASPTGLPCFLASVVSPDYPVSMWGFGCHRETEIALTRAITEAVQSRLGYIAGSRDDLYGDPPEDGPAPPAAESVSVAEVPGLVTSAAAGTTLLDDLEEVVGRATAAFGHVPLVVDLTRDDLDVPVVRVVAPGSRMSSAVA